MDAHLQTLVNYITDQLSSVRNPDDIYSQLIAAGWPEEQIREAFLAVHTQVLPTTMQGDVAATLAAAPSEPAQSLPQANGRRRGRIRTGFTLLKQSIRLLNGNRYLFRYLLMTWVVIMAVETALFIIVYFGYNLFTNASGGDSPIWFPFVFLSYVVIYFLINFYAAALASNIQGIFKGERKPYSTYIAAARSKAGPIFIFSVLDAIIGMILRYVIERIRFVGWILAWLLGTAWSLGTMFVLPMIMDTDVSAPQAIKQSVKFFKQTWGEGVAAKVTVNIPLGIVILLVALVFWPIILTLLYSGNFAGFLISLIIYLFIQITIAIIGSFANSVVNVALYCYATTHQIPPGFSADMLNQVFVKRKHRFGKKTTGADSIHPAPAS